MQNKILAITRNTIPYVKEVNWLTGGVVATILMQQLDFWFDRYPDGFYKFLEPTANHPAYKKGDSWCEELGISCHEFRTAFDAIGFRHTSKSQYAADPNKFRGKMYCSYVDRRHNLTFYLRNHILVDSRLDLLIDAIKAGKSKVEFHQLVDFSADADSAFPGEHASEATGTPQSGAQEIRRSISSEFDRQSSGNQKPAPQEILSPKVLTTEPTADLTQTTTTSLFFPRLSEAENVQLVELITTCPAAFQQPVLDEIEGRRRAGFKTQNAAIGFSLALIRAAQTGQFRPNLGIAIAAERKTLAMNQGAIAAAIKRLPDIDSLAVEQTLKRLPPTLRRKHEEAMRKLSTQDAGAAEKS